MYDHDLTPGLERTVINEPKPHALVHQAHPIAGRTEVSLREIAEEPFIMITTAPARPLIMQTFAAAGVSPRVRFCSSNFDHIRALVHQGMGYPMVSQSVGATPVHWNKRRGCGSAQRQRTPALRRHREHRPGTPHPPGPRLPGLSPSAPGCHGRLRKSKKLGESLLGARSSLRLDVQRSPDFPGGSGERLWAVVAVLLPNGLPIIGVPSGRHLETATLQTPHLLRRGQGLRPLVPGV